MFTIIALAILAVIVWPNLLWYLIGAVALYAYFRYNCGIIVRYLGSTAEEAPKQNWLLRQINNLFGGVSFEWEVWILALLLSVTLPALFPVTIAPATVIVAILCGIALLRLDTNPKKPPNEEDAAMFRNLGFVLIVCSVAVTFAPLFFAIVFDGAPLLATAVKRLLALIPAAVPFLLVFFTKPMEHIAIRIKRRWKRRRQS